jgi:predicted metal-dependent hydrolase
MAHEVAHLLEMNHSKRFWAVVESIYPDWKSARSELKQRTTSLPIL